MARKIANKVLALVGYELVRCRKPYRFVSSSLDPKRERCGLPKSALETIQAGAMRYTYKGISCLKNPFDLAIYAQLIHQTKPGTIVEIGSAAGGSALWLSDQVHSFCLDTVIYSVDIHVVTAVSAPNVKFLVGDIHHLDDSELPSLLENLRRPLMVIEDGPHSFDGSLAALEFFDKYLIPGEYIIIEDGIVNDLELQKYENGPNRAIASFLESRPGKYTIDYDLCDFFGPNVTWNTNGYLKKR